jgi:hypothetical protein
MGDHWIYEDFRKETRFFRGLFERELLLIPEKLRPLASYYLKKRLFIVNKDDILFDPRVGRPVPYLAFWFSDAMGLSDQHIVNQLALSLYYISIVVSVRDDLIDGRVVLCGKKMDEHDHIALSNFFYDKYYKIFANLFKSSSTIWSILVNTLNQWSNYETWSFLFHRRDNIPPLSKAFLKESSSYLVAITLPTIAAIAILARVHSKITTITKFLNNYCMGWKIADDIRDWRKDINLPNYNHSSVIYHAMNLSKNEKIDSKMMESMFLDRAFVISLYESIDKNYVNAKKSVSLLKSRYLNEFIETQMDFYAAERRSLLGAMDMLTNSLSATLKI